ncbi:glycerophosphodiester phosphodiesterase [Algoriphagus vanfongensis]|uniref:glycerophosphodiester phosphodiesterase n=1 Tax=Algoriphagus vanfongensis TaxID=426371 RepID=UPI0004027275|nr:glycerophosphodiester phosphodiesterase family protein [Algoriphagus vanfongensis]
MRKIILLSAFFIIGIFYSGICQVKPALPEKGLCAHRGGMDNRPENTLPAFEYSIEKGVQMIEFDVQFSKDSALVIIHDDTVDRTTNGKGKVEDLTLAELKALDAGSWFGSEYIGTQIPTLEETLRLMPQNIWINCHLKGGEALAVAVAKEILKQNREHQVLLTAEEQAIRAAKAYDQNILVSNVEGSYRNMPLVYAESTLDLGANGLQFRIPNEGKIPEKAIEILRKKGIIINYFYAKNPSELEDLWNQGMGFILVNELEIFTQEAKKIGITPVKPIF